MRNDVGPTASHLAAAATRLIVYGSLAPGRSNHHRLAHLGGAWREGWIEGECVDVGWGASLGYKAFVWRPGGPRVAAHLLRSPLLVEAEWRALDEFEGKSYRRIVVPFFAAPAGIATWGHVYAAARSAV